MHGSASAANMSEFFICSNFAENWKLQTKQFKTIKLGEYQFVFRVWFQGNKLPPDEMDGSKHCMYESYMEAFLEFLHCILYCKCT